MVRGADARTALAVVVVAGTVLGALLLRPGDSLRRDTLRRGVGVVHGGLPTGLIAVAWALGCLALYARHRGQVRGGARLSPAEERLATAVRVTLLAAAVAVPVLVVTLHRFGTPYHTPALPPGRIVSYTPHGSAAPSQGSAGLPPWMLDVVLGICAVVVLAALAYAYLRLRAEYVRKPKRPPDPTDDVRALADAVHSGRRALRGGDDARAAVIACYAAMEASLAGSGVVRRASDSPHDLLARAAGSGLRTEGSASVLTELFREARYSTHPMGDTHRRQAAAALEDIAERLGAAPGADAGAEARA